MEGYGLIECVLFVIVSLYDFDGYNGLIGLLVLSIDIKLMFENGEEVVKGELGEFWVKGL